MPTPSTGRRVGLSQQLIVTHAVTLSQHHGIDGWTIRDIATDLDVVPSVIYHYFPNKEALCDAVVDRVCAMIDLPQDNLDWKQWFTAMAHAIRPVLLRYHGVTDRLARGKFTEQFLPIIDTAYSKLHDAGFGDKSALAYSVIVNTVINTIGTRNLRSPHQTGERHDIPDMLQRFKPMMEKSPSLNSLVTTYLQSFSNPDKAERLSQQYYDLVIATVLDGVEHILLPKANPTSNTH